MAVPYNATKARQYKTPRFFNNKPLGVPLCLCGFVAVFISLNNTVMGKEFQGESSSCIENYEKKL